jgi:cytochrome c-type biogenesis protein CcmH/NrfF
MQHLTTKQKNIFSNNHCSVCQNNNIILYALLINSNDLMILKIN